MIPGTSTAVQYAGNGLTTQFSFPNKIFLATDLVVTLINTSTGAIVPNGNGQSAPQVLGLDYTIPAQWIDNDVGSQVLFAAAPATGYTVDIRSDTPETQLTSIKNQGSFLPELHEEAFDKLTRAVQDLYRLVYAFGIHGPDLESAPWPELPGPSARAGTVLGFNDDGDLSLVGSVPEGSIVSGSFSGTATGFTTSLPVSCNYQIVNGIFVTVSLQYRVLGTSNAAGFAIGGIPSILVPATTPVQELPIGTVTNNSTSTEGATVVVQAGQAQWTLYLNGSAAGWAQTNSKGWISGPTFTYCLL